MDLEVTLDIIDYEVLFSNSVELTIHESESITFSCEVGLYANSTSDYVRANLPAMAGFAREAAGAYGAVYATMPAMTASIEGGFYVPPAIQYVFGVMPAMTAFVSIGTESPISIDADMPAMQGRGFEGVYGEVSATLPMMQALAYEDPTPGELWVISKVFAMDGYHTPVQHIIFLNSTGQITSTFSGTAVRVMTILEQLQVSGTATLLGSYVLSAISTLVASAEFTQQVGTVVGEDTVYSPSFDDDGRVWVVNIDTGAAGQYDNFGFNSWLDDTGDGKCYGLADDGIYELAGTTDAGRTIDWQVDFGVSNCGIKARKKILNIYVGVSTGGTTYMKVNVDGTDHTYRVEACTRGPYDFRAKIPHDIQGHQWGFTLMSSDDTDLIGVEFVPANLTRRI